MGKICKTQKRIRQAAGNDYSLLAGFYFAHPHSPWDAGLMKTPTASFASISPQKHNFTSITEKDSTMVMNKLNNRPRKCLAFKTPNQIFFGINPSVAPRT